MCYNERKMGVVLLKSITYTEFIRALEQYGTAVHCEMYANNYTSYYSAEKPGNAEYLYDRGCVIRSDDYEYEGRQWIWRNVHQVEADADIDAVSSEFFEKANEYAKSFERYSLNVIAFTVSNGDLPPEKDRLGGWRNYARMGEVVTPDARVRRLTEEDAALIRACCAPSLTDGGDTVYGNRLAEEFSDYNFAYSQDKYALYGIFEDGVLAGMATSMYVGGLDLAWLMSIFIAPAYRGKGLGSALVRAALADYPDKKWHYQVAQKNLPSIALAKSLGFTLEGAGLYLE